MKGQFIPLLFLCLITGCEEGDKEKTVDVVAEADRIRMADIAWAKTGEIKDLEAQMAFYSDDQVPIMMPPNSPKIMGKNEILAVLERDYNRPDFSVTWAPEIVEVSESGDLGYVIGKSEATMIDDAGQKIVVEGKYIEIWKKEKSGEWKCVADIFNTIKSQPVISSLDN